MHCQWQKLSQTGVRPAVFACANITVPWPLRSASMGYLAAFSVRRKTQGLRHRVLFPLFTLGMGTLLALALGELGLRIYHRFQPLMMFYDDSYNRFRGRPFAPDWDSHLNSLGFKDEEFSKKDPSTYRILGIGDSFAFGVVPYRHNYQRLLESALQRANARAADAVDKPNTPVTTGREHRTWKYLRCSRCSWRSQACVREMKSYFGR